MCKKDKNYNMSFEEKYEIIKNNDEDYDSIFYYAVKSTGIYCRPSCKSKLPNKENVEFYNDINGIIKKGYRPCKRCRSDLLEYKPMKDFANKLKNKIDKMFMENELLNKEMNDLGFSKKRMVEIFKQEYKITPSQYMNNLRFKQAEKMLIETNESVINIAYLIGFGSISSFYRFFKEKTDISPMNYRKEKRKEKL